MEWKLRRWRANCSPSPAKLPLRQIKCRKVSIWITIFLYVNVWFIIFRNHAALTREGERISQRENYYIIMTTTQRKSSTRSRRPASFSRALADFCAHWGGPICISAVALQRVRCAIYIRYLKTQLRRAHSFSAVSILINQWRALSTNY